MLVPQDLKTHLYDEQINTIAREDTDLIDQAISTAIAESKGYLSRFNTEFIFTATEEDRDPILLTWLKDMATWHFITLANAGADIEFRESRYKSALKWHQMVQAGKIVPEGWPLSTEEGKDQVFYVTSRNKRETNY